MSNTGAKRKQYLSLKRNRLGYFFISPFLIGLFAIFLPAVAYSLYYSFCKVTINLDSVVTESVGFENYINAFTVDTQFRVMLVDAVRGMLLDMLTIIIFSFFISNVLNQSFKGRGAVRTIFFLPVLLSTGIIAAADTNNMVTSIFSAASNNGETISGAFSNSGYTVLFSLSDLLRSANLNRTVTQTLLSSVENTYSIVNASGVQILIFLSALQAIPPSIFESARVEGATKWEEFWKITFPMVTPMILVNVVYTVVDGFVNPKYGILGYIRNQAFGHNQIGFASSLSWIYFVIVLVILAIISGLISRRVHYLN